MHASQARLPADMGLVPRPIRQSSARRSLRSLGGIHANCPHAPRAPLNCPAAALPPILYRQLRCLPLRKVCTPRKRGSLPIWASCLGPFANRQPCARFARSDQFIWLGVLFFDGLITIYGIGLLRPLC